MKSALDIRVLGQQVQSPCESIGCLDSKEVSISGQVERSVLLIRVLRAYAIEAMWKLSCTPTLLL